MQMIFRIYTEDIHHSRILAICNSAFESYTVLSGIGVWKGIEERCLIVEVIGEHTLAPIVHNVAREIKERNGQEAVLVTQSNVQGELV